MAPSTLAAASWNCCDDSLYVSRFCRESTEPPSHRGELLQPHPTHRPAGPTEAGPRPGGRTPMSRALAHLKESFMDMWSHT